MNKKVNKVVALERKWNDAYKVWHNELMALIQEYGELEIKDENEGPYEDEYSKQIFTQDGNHSCVYSPRFDRVKAVEDWSGKHLEFHVKDGDGLFKDNSWVSEREFADENWLELTDWIVWPED